MKLKSPQDNPYQMGNLEGFFICPSCQRMSKKFLPYHLDYFLSLTSRQQRRFFYSHSIYCERCRTNMLLTKILNTEGQILYDGTRVFLPRKRAEFQGV